MESGEPAQIFTWDILPGTAATASSGASGTRAHAIGGLVDALSRTPEGTRGVMKAAAVDMVGDVTYVYGPIVMEAHRAAMNMVMVRLC